MLIARAVGRLSLGIALAHICAAGAGLPPNSLQPRLHSEMRARALLKRNGQYAGAQYQTALRARALMLARRTLKSQASATFPAVINWTEIGPDNVGGRLNAIWVDPSNLQHLLVGSASGGLWQSNDGGSSWSAVSEFPGSLTIGAIAQLPNGTLLVGTGDAFTAGGDGMFVSSDGGATWTPLSSTSPTSNGSFWMLINSIAVSSTSSGTVILAATGDSAGLYGGIARSVDDGETWKKVWTGSGGAGTGSSMSVAFDPRHTNDAVADDEDGGVIYSTDGGQTWAEAHGFTAVSGARVSVAFDPSVAGSVYALVDNNDDSSPSGEVYHSTDDGANWSLIAGTSAFVNADSGDTVGALCDDAAPGMTNCQGGYDNVILVEPHLSGTAPTILVGGIDIFASTDGGSTWAETGSWLNSDTDYLHADQHAFNYVASTGALYVGNDGGFYKQLTSNTWSEQNEGLAATQFYAISGHQGTTSSKNVVGGVQVTPIVAGAQDNGTLLYEGYASGQSPQPQDWIPIFGGDGGFTQVDSADGDDVYGEYVYLSLFYSSDGGPTSQNYVTLPPDSSKGNQNANFIAPFELVPNGSAPSSRMLAGGASLWLGTAIQSTEPTWTAINASGMPAKTGNSNYVSAISIDPDNPDDVWVGYDDGEVWHSTDAVTAALSGGTPSWVYANGGDSLPKRTVTSLWVVPGEPYVVYATFGGYPASGAGSNVWVTTDTGGSWLDLGSGLPRAPVYSLVTHPAYPQILYAGTLVGVFASSDAGHSWSASSVGPANVEVRQLSWFDTSSPDTPTLLAATYGRGAWLGSPAYNPTPALTSISPAEVVVGSPDTPITLTGTGFVQGVSTVTLDGNPVPSTYQSATELDVTAPLSTLATIGTHSFVVSNPIPGGGTSAAANLTVGNPVPVLGSISPTSAKAGSNTVALTVVGSGFEPSSVVQWNGAALLTTYDSATALTAVVPASDLTSATKALVVVSTPKPGGGTSSADSFAVTATGGGGALGDWALLLLFGANLRRRSSSKNRLAAAKSRNRPQTGS